MFVSDDALDALRLHLADGVGALTFSRLVEHFGSAKTAANASQRGLQEVSGIGPKTAAAIFRSSRDQKRLDDERWLAEQNGVDAILCQTDDAYPAALRHIADPPAVLYVRGVLMPEDALAIAIVGTRRASIYGRSQADAFAGGLAMAGLTVVSGLARGIDAAAHRGAMRAGGRTIAVMGHGLATLYPPEHRKLADEVVDAGAMISEFPMATRPDAGTFPVRNRIVAGMSLGTLVIEGNERSGAMITARLAIDYNRDVFALPGQVDREAAGGPNTLIRRREAELVTRPTDILDGLGGLAALSDADRLRKAIDAFGEARASDRSKPMDAPPPTLFDRVAAEPTATAPAALSPEEAAIHTALADGEMDFDQLMDATGLAIDQLAAASTTLQIKGLVEQLPGPRFARRG